MDLDKKRAFNEAEQFTFTEEYMSLIKKASKHKNVDFKNVEKIIRKLSNVVEGERNVDVFIALHSVFNGYMAKHFHEKLRKG